MSKDTPERRAHERRPVRIEIEAGPLGEESPVRMLARNLSMGGLFCVSPVGHAAMSRLAVRLPLPASAEQGQLDVEAVVVRCVERTESSEAERFELALLFANLEGERRDRLERYLTADTGD